MLRSLCTASNHIMLPVKGGCWVKLLRRYQAALLHVMLSVKGGFWRTLDCV